MNRKQAVSRCMTAVFFVAFMLTGVMTDQMWSSEDPPSGSDEDPSSGEDPSSDPSDLSTDYSDLSTDNSDLSTDYSDLSTDPSDLSSDLSELSSDLSDLSTDLSDLSSDWSDLSSLSSDSSCDPDVLLKEVAYTGGWEIEKDDGSGAYDAPQWQDNSIPPDGDNSDTGDRRYPYLYKKKTKATVLVKWKAGPQYHVSATRRTLRARGSGPDNIKFPSTVVTVDTTGISVTITANTDFPDQTKYYNPFSVAWELSCDGGKTWHGAGTSSNIIYVCLDGNGLKFRSVVHLACSNEGAKAAAEAVTKTWDLLKGPANLNAWAEAAEAWSRPLYYYKAGTDFASNPFSGAASLLQSPNDSGQCSTWAHLFAGAIKLNGAINIKYVVARPKNSEVFLVKDWTFGVGGSGDPNYPYRFEFSGAARDMVPIPTGGVFGDLTNKNTLVGQNSAPPSEKVFNNHQFILVDGTYYDASYGVTYSDANNFEATAVAGYGIDLGVHGGKRVLKVQAATGAHLIAFTELPYP